MSLRTRLILLCFSLVFINACSGDSSTPQPHLTFVPLPTPYVEGNCDAIGDFEGWLQPLEFRQRDFTDFIDQAAEKERAQLQSELVRLGSIALVVAETPTLACGEAAHQAIVQAMQNTLNNFQAYVNEDRDDLTTVIEESQRGFDQAALEMMTLKDELERRLRGG